MQLPAKVEKCAFLSVLPRDQEPCTFCFPPIPRPVCYLRDPPAQRKRHYRSQSDIIGHSSVPGACVDAYCWSGVKSKDVFRRHVKCSCLRQRRGISKFLTQVRLTISSIQWASGA